MMSLTYVLLFYAGAEFPPHRDEMTLQVQCKCMKSHRRVLQWEIVHVAIRIACTPANLITATAGRNGKEDE